MLDEFIESRHTTNDLANGRAGLLLSLLFLQRCSKEEWVKKALASCVEKIIATSMIGRKGIFWPDFYCHISGLNGFFHGAAGIGLALTIAGNSTGDKYLIYLGKEAFNYVSSTHNACMEKGIKSSEDYLLHKEKLLTGDLDFFTTPSFDANLKDEIEICYRIVQILKPANATASNDTRLQFLSAHYSRTIDFLKKFCLNELNQYLETDFSFEGFNEVDQFSDWINNLHIDKNIFDRLVDLYNFEAARIELAKNIESLALLHIQRLTKTEQALALLNTPPEIFEETILAINPQLEFYETKWNWLGCNTDDNIAKPAGEHTILLTTIEKGRTTATALNDLQHSLLSIFSSPQSIKQATTTCCALLETTAHVELINAYIRDMIQKCWICVSETDKSTKTQPFSTPTLQA